jgi:lipopolysaccharide export system permease protein
LLYDGRRVEGVPGEAEFLVAEFGEHGSPIPIGESEEPEASPASRPTSELLGSAARADRAELQGRLSTPLSLIVLALLAVPLSRSSPREGRYARMGIGLLIYVIYVDTLSIARVSVERATVPEWLGMWWVHAVLGLLAIAVLLRQSGALTKPRPFAYDSRTRHEPAA